jgi:hypothetical protein
MWGEFEMAAKVLIGREQLIEEFSKIPIEKKIGCMGAYYYKGKKMTIAHALNIYKMNFLCDFVMISLYNVSNFSLTENEINELITIFVNDNSNLPVDYIYISKDIYSMNPKYETPAAINTEEWNWYDRNTQMLSIFYINEHTYMRPLIAFIVSPREVYRLKSLADDYIAALNGRSMVWFRGIPDWPADLKWCCKYLYPDFEDSTLYNEYKRQLDNNLFSKRIYFPTVCFPSGRMSRNSNILSDKISMPHIFKEVKALDYKNITIEDLRSLINSKMPKDHYAALYNMRGNIPTTQDLHDKKVFLTVYNIVAETPVYEPDGETILIGMEDDEILEIDYTKSSIEFKKMIELGSYKVSDIDTSSTSTIQESISLIIQDIYASTENLRLSK